MQNSETESVKYAEGVEELSSSNWSVLIEDPLLHYDIPFFTYGLDFTMWW